jgi:hypothetical protein
MSTVLEHSFLHRLLSASRKCAYRRRNAQLISRMLTSPAGLFSRYILWVLLLWAEYCCVLIWMFKTNGWLFEVCWPPYVNCLKCRKMLFFLRISCIKNQPYNAGIEAKQLSLGRWFNPVSLLPCKFVSTFFSDEFFSSNLPWWNVQRQTIFVK